MALPKVSISKRVDTKMYHNKVSSMGYYWALGVWLCRSGTGMKIWIRIYRKLTQRSNPWIVEDFQKPAATASGGTQTCNDTWSHSIKQKEILCSSLSQFATLTDEESIKNNGLWMTFLGGFTKNTLTQPQPSMGWLLLTRQAKIKTPPNLENFQTMRGGLWGGIFHQPSSFPVK